MQSSGDVGLLSDVVVVITSSNAEAMSRPQKENSKQSVTVLWFICLIV